MLFKNAPEDRDHEEYEIGGFEPKYPDAKVVATRMMLGENPSAFTTANAKSLAKLGAFMANKGKIGDQTFISEETWDKIHGEPKETYGDDLGYSVFTQGGLYAYNKDIGKDEKNVGIRNFAQ